MNMNLLGEPKAGVIWNTRHQDYEDTQKLDTVKRALS